MDDKAYFLWSGIITAVVMFIAICIGDMYENYKNKKRNNRNRPTN